MASITDSGLSAGITAHIFMKLLNFHFIIACSVGCFFPTSGFAQNGQDFFGTSTGTSVGRGYTPLPTSTSFPDPTPAQEESAPVSDSDPAASVVEWQKKAIQEFPDLADPKSELNKKFVARVNELKKSKPAYFKNPKWPYQLAKTISAQQAAVIPGLALDGSGMPETTHAQEAVQTKKAAAAQPPAVKSIKPKTNKAELTPYNQLFKQNVRLEWRIDSDAAINARYNGEYSSMTDKTVTKTITISVTGIGREKAPLTVEMFFAMGGTSGQVIVPAGSQELPDGQGECQFSQSARKTQYSGDFYYYGNYQSGSKIIGWLSRAISDGQVVGVAASSEKYLNLAKNPAFLKAELARARQ